MPGILAGGSNPVLECFKGVIRMMEEQILTIQSIKNFIWFSEGVRNS
jgi:hypothetical protein